MVTELKINNQSKAVRHFTQQAKSEGISQILTERRKMVHGLKKTRTASNKGQAEIQSGRLDENKGSGERKINQRNPG